MLAAIDNAHASLTEHFENFIIARQHRADERILNYWAQQRAVMRTGCVQARELPVALNADALVEPTFCISGKHASIVSFSV
jgi:hypothetical protein